jgi:hypothetical protein
MKTKGQVENDVSAVGLKSLHIYQPGLLTNRDNDFRFGEWLGSKVPFIDKISGADLGQVILHHSIQNANSTAPVTKITHKQLVGFIQGYGLTSK